MCIRDSAESELAQEEKHRQARARKERMLQLEASAKAKSRKSDMELEREARKGAIRQMADKALDENLDLVKMLNTLGARAAAFTIRDQQGSTRERNSQLQRLISRPFSTRFG